MIEFIEFGNHKMEKRKEELIKDSLINCFKDDSRYYWLNMIYNNSQHFSNSSYASNTWQFLKELSMIANSINDKVIIMGGIHKDTGHTSGLILHQPHRNSISHGAFVTDSYIRFIIKLKSPRKLSMLNDTQVFHFLVELPEVLWTPSKNGTLLVYNIPYDFSEEIATGYYPTGYPRIQREYNGRF
jgi:hypothetical protein